MKRALHSRRWEVNPERLRRAYSKLPAEVRSLLLEPGTLSQLVADGSVTAALVADGMPAEEAEQLLRETPEAARGGSASFHLVGAGAISIHKCQGQAFTKAVLYLSSCNQSRPGPAYTALSRCVSEEGLFLGDSPHAGAMSVFDAATRFEQNLSPGTCHYVAHRRCPVCHKFFLPLWPGYKHRH